ncbi:DUF3618 domain-containing protein [Thermomonospora catenispora]|uniref:DUF3618 domain-containing protein n=1 Tax=Thermomonospora catenispora TaxID=2493090 RepID=UPI00111EBDB3|nr:DUF3618 domain-containing protein [Thermomonospora catenispora]TNY35836.1 DUF3618 domain-containing protein [Thermomonospora catenispora]
MTTSESRAAADIERTRAEIGETMEALAAKADVKARAQHKLSEVKSQFAGRSGPRAGTAGAGLAAVATAAVVAWLWRRRRMRHRSAWRRAVHMTRTRSHAKRSGLMRARARTGPAARMHSARIRHGLH